MILSQWDLIRLDFIFCHQLFIVFYILHNIITSVQNKTNSNRHIIKNLKRRERGIKSFLYIIKYVRGQTLPSINSTRFRLINSCWCIFTSHYFKEAMDLIRLDIVLLFSFFIHAFMHLADAFVQCIALMHSDQM